MSEEQQAQAALEIIDRQLKGLDATVRWSRASGDVRVGWERLNSWENRTVRLVSERVNPAEGEKLRIPHPFDLTRGAIESREDFSERQLLKDLTDQVAEYVTILEALKEQLEKHPEQILNVE